MITAAVCMVAITIDALAGEPRRGHPLAAFGALAEVIEGRWNTTGTNATVRGALAVALLAGVPSLMAVLVALLVPAPWLYGLEVLVLWLALGAHSLAEHARAVARPLAQGNLDSARTAVSLMVSRDPKQLDDTAIARATTESVLENGADAVFASLFWFALAGLPGLIAHRLINTLDAMWGYRNARFAQFGRTAARVDDLLNWIPARLTALSYLLVGNSARGRRCWRAQARHWDSPNAGPVMAAGAGALAVTLGGSAPYPEGQRERPVLGAGATPDAMIIEAALTLVRHALLLWLLVLVVLAGVL